MIEQYRNDPAATTLVGNINETDTLITVADGSQLPTTTDGPFRIRIDDEYMKCTSRSGNLLIVVRGDDGSTAASHAGGAQVRHVITKGGLISVGSNILRTGTFASRPAAGVHNRLYLSTNAPSISLDDGTNWIEFGPVYHLKPVINSDFAWVNQGTASATQVGSAVTLRDEGQGNVGSARIRKRAAPSPPYTVTALFMFAPFTRAFQGAGICIRESSTDKFTGLNTRGTSLHHTNWASHTTGSPSVVGNAISPITLPTWLRLEDDGTNHRSYWSTDGVVWELVASQSRTAHMASGGNEVGFFINAQNASTPNLAYMVTVLSWHVS